MPSLSRPRVGFVATLMLLAAISAGGCSGCFGGKSAKDTPPSPRPAETPTDIEQQVHTFCGACHEYPPPDSFPRKHWRAEVERGFRFFEQSTLRLKPPPLESVVKHYEERAPEEFPVAAVEPSSRPLGLQFEKRSYPGPAVPEKFAISNVNLVRLPDPSKPARGQTGPQPLDILACDMRAGLVMLLHPYEANPTWKVLAKIPNPAHTEVIDLDGDGFLDILVANLGSFPPTDRRCGSVVWLRGRPDGTFTPYTLLEGVGRVAAVQAADFRGIKKLDLIVGEFGWQTAGSILYLENQTTDWDKPKFVPRVLDNRHGTIHVPIADLNGDGKPDFVALISQEHETVVAFLNKGNGEFEKKTLYSAPHPGWGSSGIQLVDLNGDGRLDVLYTNGDTLDDPHLFKPYHSVQWLENKGNLLFEYHHVTPMYGVHRAVAGKLFGSRLPDIVAVGFLPTDE